MQEDTTSTRETGAPQPAFVDGVPFFALKKVETYTATPRKESQSYVRFNARRKIPRITELAGFMEPKGPDKPCILVGGGNSLNRPEIFAELQEMAKTCPVFAAGSCYDYLVQRGITPNALSVVDPDPLTIDYLQNPQAKTIFLLASQCHPTIFDHLRSYKVAMWHSYSEDDKEMLADVEPNYFGIGGGCTIGMRNISIAILFGYTNIHFFGYDSCLGAESETHAYELADKDKEMKGLLGLNGKLYPVKLGKGKPDTQTYTCMGYQLAQVYHFHDYFRAHFNYFNPTFHGGGPLADMAEIVRWEIAESIKDGTYKVEHVTP